MSNCKLLDLIDLIYDPNLQLLFPDNSDLCFTNGTFIFEDNNNQLFNLLLSCEKSYAFYKKTHKVILQTNPFFCSTKIDKEIKKCQSNDIYQYEIDIKPLKIINCNGFTVDKRVILIYSFTVKLNETHKNYIFFKLEEHQAISISHTSKAFNRYILHKETAKNNLMIRREDCFKDKSGCKLLSLFKELQYDDENYPDKEYYEDIIKKLKDQLNQIIDSINFYDKNIRTGDEYFIPQSLTEYILELLDETKSLSQSIYY